MARPWVVPWHVSVGLPSFLVAPWDMAVRWYGVERLMYDLIDNPDAALGAPGDGGGAGLIAISRVA